MTSSTRTPATADEVLAEIDAALTEIRQAQGAGDHAAAAAGYERRAAAWSALYRDECERYDVLAKASPAVLCALLRSAIPGAAIDDRRAATEYRGFVEREASGRPA